jgi:acyl-CoA synthetase (NDP forming)
MSHWLTPLLEPRSIAIVGASPREWSAGQRMIETLAPDRYGGTLYLVNPRYDEIDGTICYPTLRALPETVDLAVMAVADSRLEEQFAIVLETNTRAVSIFGSCVLEDDSDPPLAARLSAIAHEAKLPICGGNCLGYCNYQAGISVTGYRMRNREPGGIAYFAQSGSAYGAIADNSDRMPLNMAVSTGRELSVTVADYMDYALDQDSTRLIGLFLETVRDPDGFIAALEKAASRDVPVVVLKTGRTEVAARMAISHSGALVGDDQAFDAVCRRHGVLRVDTLDELAATMLLMQNERRPGPGALATIHESGGEREMIADLASENNVPFAVINEDTVAKLEARLDTGLAAENPLDAFGESDDFDGKIRDCFVALMADPDTALGVFFLDLRTDSDYSQLCAQAGVEAFATTHKPMAFATNYSAVDHYDAAIEFTRMGIPVLDGTVPALNAVRNALAYRDHRASNRETTAPAITDEVRDRWRQRLAAGETLDEADSLDLLSDYGIGVPAHRVVNSRDEAVAAAREIGLPAVLKTGAAGVLHKTDADGVRLNLGSEDAVALAYDDIAGRLGPRALVAAQVSGGGVEMILGLKNDPQYGPLVLVGAGGIFVELMGDVRAMLAPVSHAEARAAIDSLASRKLLDGVRGAAPSDVDAVVDTVTRLSWLAAHMGDALAEADINPLLAGPDGVIALDALFVPAMPNSGD